MADLITAIGGPLISAGASLLGSQMTANATNRAARMNAIAQEIANENTRKYNERLTRETWDREDARRLGDIALQKEFAQSGIQWRAADARAAGIHPALAMGAQTSSYSNSVGTASHTPGTSTGAAPFAGASMGSGIAAAGQDLSRAFAATRDALAQPDVYTQQMQKLNLEKANLENHLLASQVARATVGRPMASPGVKYMIDGQGNAPASTKRVKFDPMETQHTAGDQGIKEPHTISDVGHVRTGRTSAVPVMSDLAKDRLEEDTVGTLLWSLRNRLLPLVGYNLNPPANIPLKSKDHQWFMDALGRYKQTPKGDPNRSLFHRKKGG